VRLAIANSIGDTSYRRFNWRNNTGPLQDGYSRVWHGGTSYRRFIWLSSGGMLNEPWPSPHTANSSGGSPPPPNELATG